MNRLSFKLLTFVVVLMMGLSACGRKKDRPERGQGMGQGFAPYIPDGWTLTSDWRESVLKVKDL
jgi:hypothetical protein